MSFAFQQNTKIAKILGINCRLSRGDPDTLARTSIALQPELFNSVVSISNSSHLRQSYF